MNLSYQCPRCGARNRDQITDQPSSLRCSGCQGELETSPGGWKDGRLHHCLVCPSQELYVRKDFSQRLGVSIVVAGIILSTIALALRHSMWAYGVLFATAAIDMVAWWVTGNLLQCYYCKAEYRDLILDQQHGPFDLEVHEKYRQQAARLAQQGAASQPGSAAGNGV